MLSGHGALSLPGVAGPQVDMDEPSTALANRAGSFGSGRGSLFFKIRRLQGQCLLSPAHPGPAFAIEQWLEIPVLVETPWG